MYKSVRFIPIDTSGKAHNKKGGKAAPPSVTINSSAFTLNNRALIELSNVFGGMGFALQLFVSECGDYVGFGVKASTKELTGQQKSITSREAYELLNLCGSSKCTVGLTLENGVLVGKVN